MTRGDQVKRYLFSFFSKERHKILFLTNKKKVEAENYAFLTRKKSNYTVAKK